VTLVSGPVSLPDPKGVRTVHVETAQQMFDACIAALPADIAVCSAAVSDWAPAQVSAGKMKKSKDRNPPEINLRENPDILGTIAQTGPGRPALVVGFAAETGDLIEEAKGKRARKGCDWVVANDVSGNKVFGSDMNTVHVVSATGVESWPEAGKNEVARKLVDRIAAFFENPLSQAAE
jgi:phosphopantothenoylcysteine decarboxylase/phosphopantothenate--cysteine ligase